MPTTTSKSSFSKMGKQIGFSRDIAEKYFPIYKKTIEKYEADHPHWRIEVLVSLIKWGLGSLRHYIEDVRDSEISWESPLVELHYPIEWNWDKKLIGNLARGGHVFGKLTRENTATKELAVKTLSETMARQFNAMTLAQLTNWAWFEKRKNYFTPVFPVETTISLNEIRSKKERQEYYEELVRPFSIGAARVDIDEVIREKRVPKRILKQMDKINIHGIRFTGEVNGRKIDMGLIFEVHPMIADYGQKKAYHSIVVGLAVLNGNARVVDGELVQDTPAQWPKRYRTEFWGDLLQTVDELAGSLIPVSEKRESVILSVNSRLKIPAEHWRPENRSAEIKKITDALAQIGDCDGIEVNSNTSTADQQTCEVCGWIHDADFTQIKIKNADVVRIGGILPDIVTLIHKAHEKGFSSLSTKDSELLKICGGYRHPCKAFDDLNHRADYKSLFNTNKRGFISLRGAVGIIRNKSESRSE